MKRITAPLLIICTLLLNLLAGCDGLDENYSTNPNHRLSFSTDTLSFDTVFTTIGSATKQFMVYNKNSEPLNIERIIQASPDSVSTWTDEKVTTSTMSELQPKTACIYL